jgi:hypothetical protein
VFAAKLSKAGVDAGFVTALSKKRHQTREPEKYPGPLPAAEIRNASL